MKKRQMRHDRTVHKHLNDIKDKGLKISCLMDIIGKKNQTIRVLCAKLRENK